MKTALRRAKNEGNLLQQYATLYGQMKNFEGLQNLDKNELIRQFVVTTEDLMTKRSDGNIELAIPYQLTGNYTSSVYNADVARALLQPDIESESVTTSRIMFSFLYNNLMNKLTDSDGVFPKRSPIIAKGVSYSSGLQRTRSEKIQESENLSLFDLVAIGSKYAKNSPGTSAFYVVGTMDYELWNWMDDVEIKKVLTDLPNNNPGKAVVERFRETLDQKKYSFLRENSKNRQSYLSAMAKLANVNYLDIKTVMSGPEYANALDEVLSVINPLDGKVWSREGDTHALNFTAFVYAEEKALNQGLSVDICLGPLREDLPLNISVLEMNALMGNQIPSMIPVWYNRPNRFPDLNFDSTMDQVKEVLTNENPVNKTYSKFIAELLNKAGLTEGKTVVDLIGIKEDKKDLNDLIDLTIEFKNKVEEIRNNDLGIDPLIIAPQIRFMGGLGGWI